MLLELYSGGRWTIVLNHKPYSASETKAFTINLTTFADSKCINQCSETAYTMGTAGSDECICDERYKYLIWNKIRRRSNHEKHEPHEKRTFS